MARLAGLVSLGLLACSAEATTTMSIGTCQELQDAADATNSDKVVGELISGGVSCDDWTTVEVAANRLKLVAPDSSGDDEVFVFNNVRFLVPSGGTLRILPKVEFTGGDSQEVNGGVLNVADGGRVRFKSSVYMHDVEVKSVTEENSDFSSDTWYGGCIYNSGIIRFDDAFDLFECATDGGGESAPGNGSGVWNGETGKVVVKGPVTMDYCGTRDINGNRGGAIYNAGKFSMFDNASFTKNWSSAGGAIYNIGVLKFLKNSLATFSGNKASDTGGGHVKNVSPGEMYLRGGGVFVEAQSEYNGGAIWNDGSILILRSAEFTGNNANGDGGAIYQLASSNLRLPDDTVFDMNTADSRFYDCDNIYSYTKDGDFECLP